MAMDWTQFSGMPNWSYGVGPLGLDPNASFGSMLEPTPVDRLPPYGMGAPDVGMAAETVGGPGALSGAPGGIDPRMMQQGLQFARGLMQPRPPDVVKPSTPAQPNIKAIESGELFKLLQQLGAGGQRGAVPNLGQLLR